MKTKVSKQLREMHYFIMDKANQDHNIYAKVIGFSLLTMAERIEEITDRLVEKYPKIDPDYFFRIEPQDKPFFKAIIYNIKKLWKGQKISYSKQVLLCTVFCQRSFINLVSDKKEHMDGVRLFYKDDAQTLMLELKLENGELKKSGLYEKETNWETGFNKLLKNVELYFLNAAVPSI